MCVCVWCVCVLFVHLLEDDLRYLFNPHQVDHGCVLKAPTQVSLYKSHTTEEPLRRHRSYRYCQVLSRHSDQVGKLLMMLLPQHQRVCVVGHLLDLHVFHFSLSTKRYESLQQHTQIRKQLLPVFLLFFLPFWSRW